MQLASLIIPWSTPSDLTTPKTFNNNVFMDKIVYRFVYNRKNRLNGTGKALVQLEALQLLAKYSGTEEEFFRMRSNSNVNKHLGMLPY